MMRTALLIFCGAAGVVCAVTGQVPAPTPHPVPAFSGPGSSYIGVMVEEIDSSRAKTLKLHEEAGVEITRVEPDSPAEKAGLREGDAIMEYNGQRVEGMEQFSRLVRESPVGRDVKLDIVRNGTAQAVVVKIGARHASTPFVIAPMAPMAPRAPLAPMPRLELRMPDIPRSFMTWRSSALGIECESLEGQLAEYFGVKEGVLVRSVSKGSAAEKAGIRAGDVITRVDDAKVATPADLSSRIRSVSGRRSVSLLLMRDHKEVLLSVAMEDDDRGEWQSPQFAPIAA